MVWLSQRNSLIEPDPLPEYAPSAAISHPSQGLALPADGFDILHRIKVSRAAQI
ncbi:hypothetical protein Nwat_0944 [Nitrosococcus watsonii C-113]|uniref:Uncharacterized protein n=1 Tax=Nitrosococcus watsoni (strain C-113) TaxID=105559 RepID=D8K4R1_NITWC|nr:hypothetical protein Nwat_0944 [Nitrosococcus watsonii C-113]